MTGRRRVTLKPETAARRQQEKALELGALRQVIASLERAMHDEVYAQNWYPLVSDFSVALQLRRAELERLERYCGLREALTASPAMPSVLPLPDERYRDRIDEIARLMARGARLLLARRREQKAN